LVDGMVVMVERELGSAERGDVARRMRLDGVVMSNAAGGVGVCGSREGDTCRFGDRRLRRGHAERLAGARP
jgi:hypothetical protein